MDSAVVGAVAEVGECEALPAAEASADVVEAWDGEAGVVGPLSTMVVEME